MSWPANLTAANVEGAGLVRSLPAGPLDIVGDVHGEKEALENLLRHLAAAAREPRWLVFVGDLVDRGPDSPGVVQLVRDSMESGRAFCLLGNHELNLLLDERKQANHWFFGSPERKDDPIRRAPVRLADSETRESLRTFFRSLPLALVRDDLRIMHACWQEEAVLRAAEASDALALYETCQNEVRDLLTMSGVEDPVQHELEHQNANAVKVLTSGLEQPTDRPFEAGGRRRRLQRVRWWDDYHDEVACVFGHYSRPAGKVTEEIHREFGGTAPFAVLGPGQAICIDYGVGHRWRDRAGIALAGRPACRLAALRWPERELVFDDGETMNLESQNQR